ncbi:MAG: hypothetical protein RLY76_231, partial [Actinomycetota bacterium]
VVTLAPHEQIGGLPERPMGADCKSAGSAFSGSNPLPTTSSNSAALKVDSLSAARLY